ncbi:polymeric immunoglobulin receptor-like [Rhinoraja longicauda]
MWIPILLDLDAPVSDALWAGKDVKGVAGRTITIDCAYGAEHRSNTKYWCHGWTNQCHVLVETNGQHGRKGRVSITDNPKRGIFIVTMEDLRSGDTGWYRCGITTSGFDPLISVHLQVSDEPVSAPVLEYLSPTNGSRIGGSVSVSCESARGSLPIRYTWHEKNESGDPTISNSNQLDLSCEILRGQHRRYYCTASNGRGTKSSEILNVKVFNGAGTCSYVTEINNTVSGTLWAESEVRGVVGRTITIDCHYAAVYRSHTKYWYRGTSRQIAHVVETNGKHEQSGRVSITDNPERGIFTVVVEDLHSGDTGWYSCGITAPGEPTFKVHLQISEEPVSAPVLRYLSPTNGSRLGGSVSVFCESARGSIPIRYTWHEKNECGDPTISNSNQLDLSCEILRGQYLRYYCTASNGRGTESSEILNVKVFNGAGTCSYVTEINNTVSGALWAESEVRGVVGRAITIDCHYAAVYRSHTKYWYRGTSRQSAHVVETNGKHEQSGRVSITDNPARGIFTVAVEDLHSGDTGWYSCGITAPGEPTFKVHLQISEEGVHCSIHNGRSITNLIPWCEMSTVAKPNYVPWKVGRWLLFLLLVICSISIALFTRGSQRRDESEPGRSAHGLQ